MGRSHLLPFATVGCPQIWRRLRRLLHRRPDAPSARPHKLSWKASEEERAIIYALRCSTGFPLDDLTFVVTHFLPHLNQDAVYCILKAEGLNCLPVQSRSRKEVSHPDTDG